MLAARTLLQLSTSRTTVTAPVTRLLNRCHMSTSTTRAKGDGGAVHALQRRNTLELWGIQKLQYSNKKTSLCTVARTPQAQSVVAVAPVTTLLQSQQQHQHQHQHQRQQQQFNISSNGSHYFSVTRRGYATKKAKKAKKAAAGKGSVKANFDIDDAPINLRKVQEGLVGVGEALRKDLGAIRPGKAGP
eukprot:UC1_evm1s1151